MAFETFKSRVRIAEAPTGAAQAGIRTGQAALAALAAFQGTAEKLTGAIKQNKIATEGLAFVQEKAKQTELGQVAVSKGDFTLQEGQETFNAIVTKGHNLAQQNALRVDLANLKEEHAADPETFQAAAQGAIAGAIRGALDSESAANIRIFGENLLARDVITLNQARSDFAEKEARAEIAVNIDGQTTDALNYAYNGDLDSMGESVEALIHNIDDAIESGSIDPVKGAQLKLKIGDQVTQATITGNFDRALEVSVEGAEEFIKQVKAADIPGLNPKQKKALIDEFQSDLNTKKRELKAQQKEILEANKQQVKFEGQVANITTHIDAGVPLDFKNKEDKESVNAVYDKQFEGADLADPVVQAQQINFVKSTGVVPEAMKSSLRAALYSNNPEVIQAAAEQFNKLEQAYPQSINQFSKQDVAYAQRISSLVNSGVPVGEAVSIHQQFLKRPLAERGKQLLQQYSAQDLREMSEDATSDFVTEKYGGFFTTSPDVPPSMTIEYNRLFKDGVALLGDVEQAKQWALKNINNTWGVSEISGERELVKFPPEKVLAGVDGAVGWITNDWQRTQQELIDIKTGQIGEDLTKEKAKLQKQIQSATVSGISGIKINVDEQRARVEVIEKLEGERQLITYELLADDETRRGTPPTWIIMEVDESGIITPAIDEDGTVMRWTANYTDTPEYKEDLRLKKQKVERAKELQAIRDEINSSDIKPLLVKALRFGAKN